MGDKAEFADHLLTRGPAPWRRFLMERRNAWRSGDDGTTATLPAVLSRMIHPAWVGADGRLIDEQRHSPASLAYMHYAMSLSDPLDVPCNHRPTQPLDRRLPVEEPRQLEGFADLYFIGSDEGPIKIGVSVDPTKRLKGIQTSYPYKLQILALIPDGGMMESEYHARFAAHRLHGEWFEPHPDILAEITRLNRAQS